MKSPLNVKWKRSAKPLQYAGKISNYRFRDVLWHFVRDHNANETARATRLSANSVVGLYRKLRVFFYEAGLFTDIYDGQDALSQSANEPRFEKALLEFHFERIRVHRGLKSPAHEPDYHLAESHWRFHFHIMAGERPDAPVEAMMAAHLLEIIRLCGPVGARPANLRAGAEAIRRQTDQRLLWLVRNAPGFATPERRSALRSIVRAEPEMRQAEKWALEESDRRSGR